MRKPQIRYFASRQAYYCQHRGKQHQLATGPDDSPTGPTYRAAFAEYYKLLSGEAEGVEGDKSVASVWDAFRAFLESRRSPPTLRIRKQTWTPFVARFGTLPVRQLTHALVHNWLNEMRKPRPHPRLGYLICWDDGQVRNAVDGLQAGLNWSVKSGLIGKNPLVGLEKPAAHSRGEEPIIDPADHQKVLAVAKGGFRDFLVVLEATGARPGEILTATANHFDPVRNAIVHRANPKKGDKKHKTARTGEDRVIYLTGESLEVVKRRVALYPAGPIFGAVPKNPDWPAGKLRQWDDHDSVKRFKRLRRLTGVKLTAYSYRHTFATRWLLSGRSVEKLAELLGNSPAVIMKHYSHLARFGNDLRAELQAFRQGS